MISPQALGYDLLYHLEGGRVIEHTVDELIALGADLTVKSDGKTSLYIAAENGHLYALQALQKAGAETDIRVDGVSAFMRAVVENHADCVEWFVSLKNPHIGLEINDALCADYRRRAGNRG